MYFVYSSIISYYILLYFIILSHKLYNKENNLISIKYNVFTMYKLKMKIKIFNLKRNTMGSQLNPTIILFIQKISPIISNVERRENVPTKWVLYYKDFTVPPPGKLYFPVWYFKSWTMWKFFAQIQLCNRITWCTKKWH